MPWIQYQERVSECNQCIPGHICELGNTKGEKISIKLSGNEPSGQKIYRTPLAQRKVVQESVQELLECGIVGVSICNFTSPIVKNRLVLILQNWSEEEDKLSLQTSADPTKEAIQ